MLQGGGPELYPVMLNSELAQGPGAEANHRGLPGEVWGGSELYPKVMFGARPRAQVPRAEL